MKNKLGIFALLFGGIGLGCASLPRTRVNTDHRRPVAGVHAG